MSAFIDQRYIQQILNAVNIVDVVGNYVALKPHGKEMVGLCPFHNDSKPSLNVSEAKQIFKCFACGAGGDVIKFIMLRERMSFAEAVRLLADRVGIVLPQSSSRSNKDSRGNMSANVSRTELEKVNRWAARFFRSNYHDEQTGQQARLYIENRGLEESVVKRFGLGWAPASWDHLTKAAVKAGLDLSMLAQLGLLVEKEAGGYYDRFRERVIFPVLDPLGRVIAFGGRTLGDDPAKYINSPESPLFHKSMTLYGLHAAKDNIIKASTAIIVEGYTDCLMAHQFGIGNTVATLGTALTADHVRVLSRYAQRVILVFDGDQAGQKAAERALEEFLATKVEVSLVIMPEGDDPCDFLKSKGADAFRKLTTNSIDALDYKWRVISGRLEKEDTINGRKQATEEFLSLVAKATASGKLDDISRGFFLNRVAKVIEVPTNVVYRRVNQLQRQNYNQRRNRQIASKAAGVGVSDDVFDNYQQRIMGNSRSQSEQQVLEVLLNKPEMIGQVKEVIADPSKFSDPLLCQIAAYLWPYFERGEVVSLGEMLAGCSSTETCKIITDMAQTGADRANYELTLRGALDNLIALSAEQANQELLNLVVKAKEAFGDDAETAMLRDIQARCRPDPRRIGML